MKYLVVVVLALVNFVLQADDRPQADVLAYTSSFSAAPHGTQFASANILQVSDSRVVGVVDQRFDRSVAVDSNSGLISAANGQDSSVRFFPGLIWIFGSLVFGLIALSSGWLFRGKAEH